MPRPNVRVATTPLVAAGGPVTRAGVDEGDVAEQPDLHVLGDEAADRHRLRGLRQKLRAVYQRAVRVRAKEVIGQKLVEPIHVSTLHGRNIVVVQPLQRVEVRLIFR
jgi:hypothetical protein